MSPQMTSIANTRQIRRLGGLLEIFLDNRLTIIRFK